MEPVPPGALPVVEQTVEVRPDGGEAVVTGTEDSAVPEGGQCNGTESALGYIHSLKPSSLSLFPFQASPGRPSKPGMFRKR
ncbi:unnamed protein product [Echinostoma caproni]|uniref:ZNF35 n=1 Tax=Echinostoma caproni TaxID=27848 RepID=A0A183BH98_9TREM|nr:unnamed protein product [Echinostoma caproni]